MRLYLTQFKGAGTYEDPYRSVLADNGYRCRRVADLRTGRNRQAGWALWLCWTNDQQHQAAIRATGVVYVPLEDDKGNRLRPNQTVGDLSADNRTAILGALRQRGIPTTGLTFQTTIRELVQRLADRGELAGWLGDDNLPDDLTQTLGTLSAAQSTRLRAKLEARGYTVAATASTTIEELLITLMEQRKIPELRESSLP